MRWWRVRGNEWQLGEEPHRPRGAVGYSRGVWRWWACYPAALGDGSAHVDLDEAMRAVEGALRRAGMRGLVEPVPRFVEVHLGGHEYEWRPAALVAP